MLKMLTVARNQRVVVLRDARVTHVLQPGHHWVWTWPGMFEAVVVDVTAPLAARTESDPLPDELEGATLLRVGVGEVVLRVVAGRVRQVLPPGTYRVWEGAIDTELTRVDVLAKPEALSGNDRLEPALPAWAEATASKWTALVLRRDGEPIEVLPPGRYRVWTAGPWTVVPLHLGKRPLELAAQDLVTRDQVPVRVKPAALWRVSDPMARLTEPEGEAQLYAALQLALREAVAARSFDALVADREALSTELVERARRELREVGIAIEAAWVKDITLSAEVKSLVHRVHLARMEAEATSIKRREEVAATRQLANTAKLLEKNPVLTRLKELEALGELVGKIDKLVVVGSPDLAKQVILGATE